uniref:Uncharacterized protein n=1 Tax=Anopheles funestus TaxID=62324 RepID=A0A182R4W8_ANOFN
MHQTRNATEKRRKIHVYFYDTRQRTGSGNGRFSDSQHTVHKTSLPANNRIYRSSRATASGAKKKVNTNVTPV